MIGETLAHYRITHKLGAGGMGEVYRATDSKLHRDVAIKVLPAAFAADPDRMARFQREAQVLASLTHGSIAAVYGLEDANGSKALVMELVEGEDLSDRIRRGPLPLEETLHLASQIAEALEAAHDHGIIHRDLKPANIKLLGDGHIKLLDFGLAKALEGASAAHLTAGESATLSLAATQAGIILGTAAYMSPEQATGAVVDRRADVWSFGVVVFEMLTGRRLFDGETTSHVLADVIRAEIDFSRLPPTTPRELRELLERCLERDARRRLRDIREARLVLERLSERQASGQSVLRTAAATAPRRPAGWRDRLPSAAAGALAAGLLVAGFAAWIWPASTPSALTRVEARLTDDELFSNVGAAFDISPDGRWIAFATVLGGGLRGEGALHVRRMSELQSTTLIRTTDNDQRAYNPFFAPDGSWVGYATPTELRKVPVGGGTPLTICKVQLSRGASWGPDDTIVLAPAPGSGLFRVPAAGGEPQPLTTVDGKKKEVTHRWPQILPGGKAALFTSHTKPGDFESAAIEVVSLETGERTVVHNGGSYARYVHSGHLVYLHENTLFALPFDLKGLKATGQPVPVVQNITGSDAQGAAQFAFSATGLMAYRQGATPMPTHPIVWVDRTGGTTPLLDEPGTYVNPRLSSDGRQLSLTVFRNGNWDIWVHDLERRVSTRVTFDETAETEQAWSPDGREVAYVSERGERQAVVYRKSADGSGVETEVFVTDDTVIFPQSWSPDGTMLAFTNGNGDIGVLPIKGKPVTTLIVNSRFEETDPAFSPDGRWVAYTSRESGQPEIYVRRFPSGSGRAQISNDGGAFARWARGGRELFYRTQHGVMAVSIELGAESLRSGNPRELFRRDFLGGLDGIAVGRYAFADFDVAPDGSRFVMFPKVSAPTDRNRGMVTLVSNWFEDLSRMASKSR